MSNQNDGVWVNLRAVTSKTGNVFYSSGVMDIQELADLFGDHVQVLLFKNNFDNKEGFSLKLVAGDPKYATSLTEKPQKQVSHPPQRPAPQVQAQTHAVGVNKNLKRL
jgi:hypothetical protein